MKTLESYGIIKDNGISYNSKLCSVACSIGYMEQYSPLDNRINDLVKSFFNQWQFVISTYEKLYKLFSSINETSDLHDKVHVFSDYDKASVESEMDFRNYSYLLLVSMKTYLDLFACIVDITQNRIVREEHKLPDFSLLGKKSDYILSPEVMVEFEKMRNKDIFPWIDLLKEVRNRIVHRGYSLKPKFGFTKSNELSVQVYKGTDFYTDAIELNIGELFNDFMTTFPANEDKVARLLLDNKKELNRNLLLEVSFRYDGLINEYSYKETGLDLL